jgi:hypothetical protein
MTVAVNAMMKKHSLRGPPNSADPTGCSEVSGHVEGKGAHGGGGGQQGSRAGSSGIGDTQITEQPAATVQGVHHHNGFQSTNHLVTNCPLLQTVLTQQAAVMSVDITRKGIGRNGVGGGVVGGWGATRVTYTGSSIRNGGKAGASGRSTMHQHHHGRHRKASTPMTSHLLWDQFLGKHQSDIDPRTTTRQTIRLNTQTMPQNNKVN